jgi:outer membrane protein TolC
VALFKEDLSMNIIYSFFLFVPFLCLAKSYSPTQLALLAEERAPLIKMQIENQSAATRQISQSRLIANPILSIQSGTLKSGSQAGAVVDVTLNQPIPWPGKRQADINSAKILERITATDLEESKLLVNHSVSLLSLELASLVELEKHNKERKHRFSIIHRFLTSRPLASPSQMVEKNLIETQIRLVETQMFDIETKKNSISEQLSMLTGQSDLSIDLNWSSIKDPPSKESFLKLIEESPDYKRSQKFEELAQNRVEQASYLARPDILVGLNYREENVAPKNHFYHANFAIVIPIIDRGQHSIERAKAEARREEASKKLVLLNSSASLNRSYQVLISAHHSTKIFNVRDMKKTERQFHEAEAAFRKGRIDVTTFLQSDMQIHESIDLAYISMIKYYTALSELRMLTGQKLDI